MLRSTRTAAIVIVSIAAAAGVPHAQTVDEIIAKNLKAKGGEERLKAVNTVKISGNIVMQGVEHAMTSWAKRPNMFRRELRLQGNTLVVSFDGAMVWWINPEATGSSEPKEVTGPQADMTKDQADFDGPLIDYRRRGFTIELIGKETLKNKPVYHLKITSKTGQVQHYYLDVDTGLELRTVGTLEQGGMKAEIATDLSNYQQVNGFALPFSMEQSMNGTPAAQITIQSVEFNVPMEDSFFKMPVKK